MIWKQRAEEAITCIKFSKKIREMYKIFPLLFLKIFRFVIAFSFHDDLAETDYLTKRGRMVIIGGLIDKYIQELRLN